MIEAGCPIHAALSHEWAFSKARTNSYFTTTTGVTPDSRPIAITK